MKNLYYKKESTPEEREECFTWFEQNMDRLPKTLKLDALDIQDLPFCVRRLIKSLKIHLVQASIYEGQLSLLRLIRQVLLQTPEFQK